MHGVQVADGHVLQRVLQRVQHGRHDQLPPVAGEDGVVDLFEDDGPRRRGRERARGLGDGEREARGPLEDLAQEDGRRREVSVVAHLGHDPRVVHDLGVSVEARRDAIGQIVRAVIPG